MSRLPVGTSVVAVAAAFALLVSTARPAAAVTIYVKLMVDDEEPAKPEVWKSRLRKRLEKASAVIEQYADVKFTVLAYGVWKSDNGQRDLDLTLQEFERKANPAPAQIAIGFSSQYRFVKGRNSLGGTHGPLRRHILLRENSPNLRESERLEALVHELGHFLGAAHSADENSAMRPVLGDGKARARAFRIGFDKLNGLAIRLVASEMNTRQVKRFDQLSADTRKQLREIYLGLQQASPRDPAATNFLRLLLAVESDQRRPQGVP